MAQVPVFWVHPIGRSPQANAGFRKLDERGASVAKQEFFIGRKVTRTSGRGLAVRFGPASCASLVISFCRQEWFYLLAGKFVYCCMFLLPRSPGAEAIHTPVLNTSSTYPLRCFRTFRQQGRLPTNTEFTVYIFPVFPALLLFLLPSLRSTGTQGLRALPRSDLLRRFLYL